MVDTETDEGPYEGGDGPMRVVGDLVFMAALLIAVILIGHIILVLLAANPDNRIVSTDAAWAGWLAAWFKDLFTPANPKLSVLLNYGLATIFYVAVGGILGRLLNDAFG